MTGIVYCDECGQASGFTGNTPPARFLTHADWCCYGVEDYATWDDDPIPHVPNETD